MNILPWDSEKSNPLQDIRDFLRAERAKLWEPDYEPLYVHTLTGDGNYHKPFTLEGESRVSKGVAIVSGGLDSTTMIYHLLKEGHELDLVSFDYGQRHGRKELKAAMNIASQLGLQWDLVNLRGLTHLIDNSALTSDKVDFAIGAGQSDQRTIEVPDGHYAEETMKATVVPNRNMIMLSIAAGIAVNRKANFVATGVHAGDHFIYPDCRPAFVEYAGRTIFLGNEGFADFEFTDEFGPIKAPFIAQTKTDIAYKALELGVPIHLTWSCYKGGDKHCGRCGTCVERLEAIDAAVKRINVRYGHHHTASEVDATEYEDTEFWKQAIREAKNG